MRRLTPLLSFLIFCVLASGVTSAQSVEDPIAACMPLPQGIVPDESDGTWNLRTDVGSVFGYVNKITGKVEAYEQSKYYKRPDGMRMGVYSYFGKVAWRAWSCGVNRDPQTGDTPDHMIGVLKEDGTWVTVQAEHPDSIQFVVATDGALVAITLKLQGVTYMFQK